MATEYARMQQSSETSGAPSSSSSVHRNVPPPPRASSKPESTLERLTNSAVALLNPLDDEISSKPATSDRVVMLPWEQPGLSEGTRTRMRALSQERSIFLAPPTGGHASFRFDLEASLPLILEALSVDRRLDEQRNLLVPSQVSEEQFFTNYFHHLHVMASAGGGGGGGGGEGASNGGGGRGTSAGGGGAGGRQQWVSGGLSGSQSPRTETSSSPVLVSAAVSEASDLAQPKDVGDSSDAGVGGAGGGAGGGAIGGGAGGEGAAGDAGPTPRAGGKVLREMPPLESAVVTATKCEASIEEQFECVSSHLLESAKFGAASGRVTSAQPSRQAKVSAQVNASTTTACSSSQAQALSWEEELRAELS